jgi:adenine-specific DNA-methyltransferase
MPPRKKAKPEAGQVSDYRHESAKRRNNPPAGLASQGRVKETPKLHYAYDPHLPPILRFDPDGLSDRAGKLLGQAVEAPLTPEEASELAAMLHNREPWLEWTGKREAKEFVVDPVALHIHERISAQAILKTLAREDVQKDMFADPQQEYREAVRFYEHDVDWSNRMILGDSLQVMASLADREDLAGKVQMIYMDPPYGIRFASNFQPEIGKRDVKDKESDMTREPEMVKAYRDTWTLGVHSYLSYLRDRLILARDLLTDSGSIFVQISDENLHRVRAVMDEVFGADNAVAVISFRTTSSLGGSYLGKANAFLIWFARDINRLKYRHVYTSRGLEDDIGNRYSRIELANGAREAIASVGRSAIEDQSSVVYRHDNLTSQSGGETVTYPVSFRGIRIRPAAATGRPMRREWKGCGEQRGSEHPRQTRSHMSDT